MITSVIEESKLEQMRAMIDASERIVLTCHKSPDGDALGSTMGLREVLERLGKHATVIVPNAASDSLMFLPKSDEIVVCDSVEPEVVAEKFDNAQLLFCMDYNDPNRTQGLQEYIEIFKGNKVLIDHHLGPKDFCDLTFSFPELSSTCELAYRLVRELGYDKIMGKLAASFFYMGLVTDTGNFAYNSSNPETFEIAAALLRFGINKDEIYNKAFNSQKENSIRLQCYALQHNMKVKRDLGIALVTLSQETLRRYFYTNGDTEGLVNKPLKIPEVFCSVFMREDESCIKISMRSLGDFSVRDLCEKYFNGGGHKNAAAGEFRGTLEQAVDAYYRMLLKEKESILKFNEIYKKKR